MDIKVIVPRNEVVMVKEDLPMFTTLQEGEQLVELGSFNNCIKPLWDDIVNDFIENASQEVLDKIEMQKMEQLFMPSQEEIDKATREIETITLLAELGVI